MVRFLRKTSLSQVQHTVVVGSVVQFCSIVWRCCKERAGWKDDSAITLSDKRHSFIVTRLSYRLGLRFPTCGPRLDSSCQVNRFTAMIGVIKTTKLGVMWKEPPCSNILRRCINSTCFVWVRNLVSHTKGKT